VTWLPKSTMRTLSWCCSLIESSLSGPSLRPLR